MGLNYFAQLDEYLIGNESSTSTLTAAYADNQGSFTIAGMSQVVAYVQYTPAQDGRMITVQAEFGPERSDVYKTVSVDSSTTGDTAYVNPLSFVGDTASVTYKIRYSIPIADKEVRISAKENGTTNFGTVKIRITASGL